MTNAKTSFLGDSDAEMEWTGDPYKDELLVERQFFSSARFASSTRSRAMPVDKDIRIPYPSDTTQGLVDAANPVFGAQEFFQPEVWPEDVTEEYPSRPYQGAGQRDASPGTHLGYHSEKSRYASMEPISTTTNAVNFNMGFPPLDPAEEYLPCAPSAIHAAKLCLEPVDSVLLRPTVRTCSPEMVPQSLVETIGSMQHSHLEAQQPLYQETSQQLHTRASTPGTFTGSHAAHTGSPDGTWIFDHHHRMEGAQHVFSKKAQQDHEPGDTAPHELGAFHDPISGPRIHDPPGRPSPQTAPLPPPNRSPSTPPPPPTRQRDPRSHPPGTRRQRPLTPAELLAPHRRCSGCRTVFPRALFPRATRECIVCATQKGRNAADRAGVPFDYRAWQAEMEARAQVSRGKGKKVTGWVWRGEQERYLRRWLRDPVGARREERVAGCGEEGQDAVGAAGMSVSREGSADRGVHEEG